MQPPMFLADAAALGDAGTDRIRLAGAEGRHAAAVRRLRLGERVDLTDGAGSVAACVVTAAGADWLDLAVTGRGYVEPPAPRLVVVQALAKGDRGQHAVEAMTEVGVDEIVPWAASRSVVEWRGERGSKALQRWRSVAREATKQARRPWLPVVCEPASTPEVTDRLARAELAVVLHGAGSMLLAELELPPRGEVVAVVGPEGGLTDEEVARFVDVGAVPCRLGPTVLRTSTAGVAAAAVLLAGSGRWS